MGEVRAIRKIFASMVVLLSPLLVTACGEDVPWKAPLNPEFVQYLKKASEQPEEPVFRTLSEDGRALGYIPSPRTPERHVPQHVHAEGSASDPRYDMRDPNGDGDPSDSLLPAVRSQGNCGTCWAFATYGSFESHIKQRLGEVQDLSEDNLKHLHGFDWGPCDGGNFDISTAYLSRYDGPISESDDPYSDAPDSVYCTDCSPLRYTDNVLFLPTRASTSDNAYIKQAILDYGGVMTCMYWTDSSYASTSHTYYYSGSSYCNHGVVIVGWDDNKYVPNAPVGERYGAFIVRNSWGSSWGEGGYFYVSYYDRKIAFQALGCFDERPETAFSFDRVYFYDKLGYIDSWGYESTVAWAANWFVPTQDEDLTAVGFYATDSPTAYEIYIYENFSGDTFSGLRAAKSGTVPYPGWYTVVLDDPVPLLQGDGFGVVVKFTTDDYIGPIPMEEPISGYSSAAMAEPGQSYVSSDGSSWTDVTSVAGCSECNVCIKAFLSDPAGEPPIPLPAPEAYGRISGGDQTHVNEVNYRFEGTPGDVTIRYQVWDVDFANEVEILVNGVRAGYAAVTPNNTWSEARYIVLPDAAVFDDEENELTFNNTYNPPKTYWWGVRNVSVFEECPDCIPLPDAAAYGRISGGDQTHANEVNYLFIGAPGNVTIFYQVWDVDLSTEVKILVNGEVLGYAPVTPNETWSGTLSVVLPDAMVFDGITNVLTFDNTYNPPKTYRWGVRNVTY